MKALIELRMANDKLRIVKIFCVLFCVFCGLIASVTAQSTSQNFPTAITANEISGEIPARDVGDARLTSYFYVFNATQGDVFINVLTSNLNGDIDVFTYDNLRPLSKITIYADTSASETGRIVYLRQPLKLLLRIEGRSPNDNAATYRIKFAGSFAPAEAVAESAESAVPQIKTDNQTDVRVNSVGTIIEIKPKPTPPVKAAAAEVARETEESSAEKTPVAAAEAEPEKPANQTTTTEAASPTIENSKETAAIVMTEAAKNETTEIETPETEAPKKSKETIKPIKPLKKKTVAKKPAAVKEPTAETTPEASVKPKTVKPLPASALENIRLVVLFKDGTKIERPMSDVLKVGVDKGILTVIAKDGRINRYSILDVEKMTIE